LAVCEVLQQAAAVHPVMRHILVEFSSLLHVSETLLLVTNDIKYVAAKDPVSHLSQAVIPIVCNVDPTTSYMVWLNM
jgi:hypothetical protein